MLIAFLADIHANREALEAVLADAKARGVERLVFLGDVVGYGADPSFAVDAVAERVAAGALAVLGNHDAAIEDGTEGMNPVAAAALDWTRGRLDTAQRAFLRSLPLAVEEDDRLYVHASAHRPRDWAYVTDAREADLSFAATARRLTFVGHVHRSALYHVGPSGRAEALRPRPGTPTQLLAQRRWLAVLPAVGQPRDGSTAAGYALLDAARGALTVLRTPYDAERAAAKIRAAGLPEALARRLTGG